MRIFFYKSKNGSTLGTMMLTCNRCLSSVSTDIDVNKLSFVFQAIFDRNRKDELPGLQLEWIDGICSPLYEVTLEDLWPSLCAACHTSASDISSHRPSPVIVLH